MKKKREGRIPCTGIRCKRFVLSIKLCITLLIASCMQISAAEYFQNIKLDITLTNVSLETLLRTIKNQANVNFLYNIKEIEAAGSVSVNLEGASIEDILNEALKTKALTYTQRNDVFVIRPKTLSTPQQVITHYKVTGRVTDEKNNPLPGVTVRIDGTAAGVVTNTNGEFSIQLPPKPGNLIFSFVGYKPQKIAYTGNMNINISLKEDVTDLEEVQVIAYGERKKREVISSISSVKAEEMKELPTDNLLNMLQGRMAGVEITSQGGSPGGKNQQIIIRGLSSITNTAGGSDGSPLFVIDGVPMHSFVSPMTGSNTLADLDPTTIESVEVLKDAAAAAIYGSRAANGVILITTKKGRAGKSMFAANISYTISHMPEYPTQIGGRLEREILLKMLQNYKTTNSGEGFIYHDSHEDAYGSTAYYDWWWKNGEKAMAGSAPILQDSLNSFYNNQTNWWKRFFRVAGVVNANIQASGGSDAFTYMLSAGYYNEKGINIGSDFARVSMLMNMSAKPTRHVTIDGRVHLSYTDKSRNARNNGLAASREFEGISANPSTASTLEAATGIYEDEALKKYLGTISKNDNYRLMSNMRVGLKLLKDLHFTTNFGIDYAQAQTNVFEDASITGAKIGNRSSGSVTRNIGLSNENLLIYKASINDLHNLELLAGLSYTGDETHAIAGEAHNLGSDKIQYVPDGSGSVQQDGNSYSANQSYSSNFEKRTMLSYLGRIAYNYDSRYLVEFTYRRDGSSVFGEDVRWANFPAIALGWTFSDETFMEWAPWMNLGKLRASWGKSGQIFQKPYIAHGLMGSSSTTSMGTITHAGNVINKELTWEKCDQYDIGLDLDLFHYRLKLKMDYYYRNTTGLLEEVQLAGNFKGGYRTQIQNALEVANEGIELEAIVDIFRDSKVKWRSKFNASRNWNMFKKSVNGEDMLTSGLIIGKPLKQLKVYLDDGYYQSDDEIPYVYKQDGGREPLSYYMGADVPMRKGMRKVIDLNGDGKINNADMYYAGSTYPIVSGGWTNELKWNNFDLNILVSYALGRKMINEFQVNSLNPMVISKGNPIFIDVNSLSFWQKTGDNTDMPEFAYYAGNSLQYSRQYKSCIENVHYARIKQLTLGYNLPSSIARKVYVNGIRVFFTGENLLLLTNYSGMDPEVVPLSDGIDRMEKYPLSRKWTFGLTVNF